MFYSHESTSRILLEYCHRLSAGRGRVADADMFAQVLTSRQHGVATVWYVHPQAEFDRSLTNPGLSLPSDPSQL